MDWQIRAATASDCAGLTALMHGSAAYAGVYYRIIRDYGVSPAQIARDCIRLAEQKGRLGGFYSLITEGTPELDLMFVADELQGSGLGRLLFDHMIGVAADMGIAEIAIVSHPPATHFYERMGAVIVGERAPSATASWVRPILHLAIAAR